LPSRRCGAPFTELLRSDARMASRFSSLVWSSPSTCAPRRATLPQLRGASGPPLRELDAPRTFELDVPRAFDLDAPRALEPDLPAALEIAPRPRDPAGLFRGSSGRASPPPARDVGFDPREDPGEERPAAPPPLPAVPPSLPEVPPPLVEVAFRPPATGIARSGGRPRPVPGRVGPSLPGAGMPRSVAVTDPGLFECQPRDQGKHVRKNNSQLNPSQGLQQTVTFA
jgi:hypothetical protein